MSTTPSTRTSVSAAENLQLLIENSGNWEGSGGKASLPMTLNASESLLRYVILHCQV